MLPAGPLKILKNRNYLKYFSGQLVSMSGTWMQSVTQSWLVFRLSHSSAWLGIIAFSGTLPAFLAAPLAGFVADAGDRRRVLIIVQIIELVQAFVLAALVFTHSVQLWHIVVLSVLLGIVNAFDMTTRHAFSIDMVGKEDLSSAIALNSVLINIARVFGPVLAGFLLAAVGEAWCFTLNGLSYVPVIWSLASMVLKPRERRTSTKSMWHEIKEGAAYARGNVVIFRILVLSTVICFVACPYGVLLPVFAKNVLHGGAETFAWLTGMLGCGAVTAALLFRGNNDLGSVRRKLIADIIFWGVGLMTLGLSHSFWLSMGAMFSLGYFMMSVFPTMNNAIQQLVDDRIRGRVMSLYTMTFLGSVPLGSLVMGALADRYTASRVVTGAGALTALIGFGLILRSALRAPAVNRI